MAQPLEQAQPQPQPQKAFPVSWDQFHRDARAAARGAFRDRLREAHGPTHGRHVHYRSIARHLDLFSLGHRPCLPAADPGRWIVEARPAAFGYDRAHYAATSRPEEEWPWTPSRRN